VKQRFSLLLLSPTSFTFPGKLPVAIERRILNLRKIFCSLYLCSPTTFLRPGFELGAVKELARLVLQLRYGHVTSAPLPSTTLPSAGAATSSSSQQLPGSNVPMPRHGGATVLGPGLESELPPLREPAVLDGVSEIE